MTVVEVLVASAVSTLVASAAAGLVSAGDRAATGAAAHLDRAVTVARLVERWPVAAAASVGQRRDTDGTWWLCGSPSCGVGNDVVVAAPHGDATLLQLTTAVHGPRTEVRFTWQLDDATTITVVGWRGAP